MLLLVNSFEKNNISALFLRRAKALRLGLFKDIVHFSVELEMKKGRGRK